MSLQGSALLALLGHVGKLNKRPGSSPNTRICQWCSAAVVHKVKAGVTRSLAHANVKEALELWRTSRRCDLGVESVSFAFNYSAETRLGLYVG